MLGGLGAALMVGSFYGSGACGSSSSKVESTDAAIADGSVRDAQPTPFTDAAMRSAADAFNAKYCTAFAKFDPTYFAFTFGEMAACLGAGGLVATAAGDVRYVDELGAPYAHGSRLTPDALRACAAALDFSSAAAWVRFNSEHIVPDECEAAFFGTLLDDSPCGVWNQCKSGRCLPPGDADPGACGRCTPQQPNVGAPCQSYTCAPGLTCRTMANNAKRCVAYASVGQSCQVEGPGVIPAREGVLPGKNRFAFSSTDQPCHDDLVCVAGMCASPLADCDPKIGCSVVPNLRYCNPSTR
jgi:hypothetical protein